MENLPVIMKPLISKKLFKSIANKYLVAFMVFSVWMIFIDDNNIFFLRKNVNTLKEYRVEKANFLEKIRTDSIQLQEMKANAKNLEKFAREEFLMKKKDEDIFLIIER
jgi:cell division protein DivIC